MDEDEKDPDTYGNWQYEEKPCACHCSYLRAKKFYRVDCDFMDRTSKIVLDVFLSDTALSGLDITHTALEVHYECVLCLKIAYKTYEIVCEDETSDRWGRYMTTYGDEPIVGIRTTDFDGIQRVFDGMWKDYNLIVNNCKHWTDDMIRRLS
ncbi:hypothetical protein niasHS_018150 [Heterodera schachtii]|uniref:PPPDE domain-containing protein n=2 Tax=Heterodera TaxID=34509 RepID=A0ABD2HVI2_HETSC